MLFFSTLLKINPQYSLSADNLFSALSDSGEKFTLFDGAKGIWARDYMPIKTKSGQYISFRYEPNYLADDPQLRTNFKTDIAPYFTLPVTYSNINFDGGNVVFSPSKSKAVITDRVFSENPEYDKNTLLLELENLLEAEIIIIPSLISDMTGHADGVVIIAHDAAPGLGALEHRDTGSVGGHDLGVIIMYGSGADHAAGTLDIFSKMAETDGNTLGDQFVGRGGGAAVRAGDDHAHFLQYQAQGAHGNAANAHQMYLFPGLQILPDDLVTIIHISNILR